ncbi:MAG: transposase [Salinibacter sp.]|uniref:transposase n=1 Tax=Salinibacter sp. TaxID=2065818 RepID=UPI0035D49929
MLDTIMCSVKIGTQWHMLPGEFAQWRAAHYYFRRWRKEGQILCILCITSRTARRRAGRFLLREWAESTVSTPSGKAPPLNPM